MKHVKIRQAIFDLFNGIHSGIPLCCIKFFITFHFKYPGVPVAQDVKWNRGIAHDAGYVTCNSCHAQHRVVKIRDNGMILRGFNK